MLGISSTACEQPNAAAFSRDLTHVGGIRALPPSLAEEIVATLKSLRKDELLYPDLGIETFNADRALQRLEAQAHKAANAEIARALKKGVLQTSISTDAADLSGLPNLTVSAPGFFHLSDDVPLQDYALVHGEGRSDLRLAVLSDGVSSAKYSHLGARALCHAAAVIIDECLTPAIAQGQTESILDSSFLARLHTELCRCIIEISKLAEIHPLNAIDAMFSATLQCAVVSPHETFVIALADGFFGQANAFRSIELVTDRTMPDFNTPPLIGRAIEEEARSQLKWKARGNYSIPRDERFLFEEAASFKVVFHGCTKDVLTSALVLTSDGLVYTDGVAYSSPTPALPVLHFLDDEAPSVSGFTETTSLLHVHALAALRRDIAKAHNVWQKADHAKLDVPAWQSFYAQAEDKSCAVYLACEFLRANGLGRHVPDGLSHQKLLQALERQLSKSSPAGAAFTNFIRDRHDRLIATVFAQADLALEANPDAAEFKALVKAFSCTVPNPDPLAAIRERLIQTHENYSLRENLERINKESWARAARERLVHVLARAAVIALKNRYNFALSEAAQNLGDDLIIARLGPLQ